MTWQNQRRRRTPIGLRNLGNTCYLNSVLQCLTYTPPLAQFCLSKQHSSTCKTLKECAFCILERQISRSLTLEASVVDSPIKIQKCIAQLAENFRLGRQEDAHEFLRYVIDACHNTCSRSTKKITGSPSCNGGSIGPTSAMNEIFGGALLSQVKCLSCKGESNKTDEILDISLDIFQTNSLKDAFGRFFQPEILDGNNKYDCSKCKKLSVAKKQMFVFRAPNVLVIQFKRFEGTYSGKINKNIEFEEVLSLSKFMCSTAKDCQPEYSLIGSIVHSGLSPESGHYYAYIKDPFGRWYCCNDSQVSLSSVQEVLSEKVYILFYLRNNPNPKHIKSTSPCTYKPYPSDTESSSTRLNGQAAFKNNGSSITNGNKCASSQMKFSNIKNPGTKKLLSNGSVNHLANTNGSIEINGNHKVTPAGKENATPPSNGSLNKSKSENRVNLPSIESIANKVESGKKKILQISNGSMHNNENEEHKDDATLNVSAIDKELDQVSPSSNMHLKNENNTTTLKRKSCDDKKDEGLEGCNKKQIIAPRIDPHALCRTPILCEGNRCKELESFKEIITSEAISSLRSFGWVNDVYNFMHTRKKICTQTAGKTLDNTELRKQLKDDAESFVSQIPESLKEHLIEKLRSFSKGKKHLIDS